MPSSTQPDPELTWFVDRSIGRRRTPDALRAAGMTLIVHDETFPQDAPDEVWLTEAGANDWVVLSRDQRIRYRVSERVAVEMAAVRMFVFVGGCATADEMSAAFLRARPRMERLAKEHPPPFIAKVHKSGSVALWWP